MADIRRSLGTAGEGKAPLVTAELRRLVRLSGPTPLAEARDWGLFLVRFAAGLRRSELVAVNVRDLEESEHGLVVHLRRSKTDQETCPVRALRHWLAVERSARARCFRRGA